MEDKLYSVEEVADLLGLHVRTVRGYIHAGRLRAVRIGKQYRIAAADLEALIGRPRVGGSASVEVSSIVQVEGVDRLAADRLGTLVLAAVNTGGNSGRQLRVQVVHDVERSRMKFVILGGAADTADVLRLLDDVLAQEDDGG
ncbi:excisionase family DNA binding protein [Actinomadura pelletieri DSM 43383]|uniref:Excisionase family DNA binding protein n=1 Tax=Actinomadura pelletieri DSM 43383 TaxID=1120940 RepID=A0A495QFZ4_9ACTN|nr:helix-turn-helix domain-containing protein [Actinomadura pelletieri]RKS70795.1 excisionase family DNA binding protein [Actinomadura pelletieri DSM 43383]